jgi:hypothetical protein
MTPPLMAIAFVLIVICFRLIGREPYEPFEHELRADLKPGDTKGTSFGMANAVTALLVAPVLIAAAVVLRSWYIGAAVVCVALVALFVGNVTKGTEKTAAQYGLKVTYPYGRHAFAVVVTLLVLVSSAIGVALGVLIFF